MVLLKQNLSLITLREDAYRSNPDDRTDPYSKHNWWVFDAKDTSPKTCPTCHSLAGSHYRGDELYGAFPWHIQRNANTIRAKVHPHCRCLLKWAGHTKRVVTNPYGVVDPDRKRQRVEPEAKLHFSPSQLKLFNRTAKFSRETLKKRKCKCGRTP